MTNRLHTIATAFALASGLLAMQPSQAQNLQKGERVDENGVNDRTVDAMKTMKTGTSPYDRPEAGSSRKGKNPVLFLIGDSTMRTGTKGNGDNGQWGWGFFAHLWFDEERITVENHALGGTSSRTFYNDLWPDVLKGIQKGDYVIIQLGHNDNGPLDTWTARNSIKGIDPDTMAYVTLHDCRYPDWNGRKDTVVSYGEYMRRYIREIRAKGAFPILASLTPRNSWDDERTITRKWDTFTPWGKAIAIEMQCPWIDLEGYSARRLEQFGPWKTNGMFTPLDKIHTSAFGAQNNAYSAALAIRDCVEPPVGAMGDGYLPLKTYLKDLTQPAAEVKREAGKPVVWITGDSTVKIDGNSPMVGWGQLAGDVFNTAMCTPVNLAKAGRSTRTYMNEGRWEQVYNAIQPGDIVLIQFGHNDIGEIGKGKDRGTLPYAYDTCHVYTRAADGVNEMVYSFGWYLKRFISDVREKGGIPVLVSLTPRNEWEDGIHIERRNDTYGKWYREVVEATGVAFLDLHNMTADQYDKMGREAVRPYYQNDHTHTSKLGARVNAANVARGMRQLGFGNLVHDEGYLSLYDGSRQLCLDKFVETPQQLKLSVPNGNWRVTLTIGSKKRAAETTVRSENRRLMVDKMVTKRKEQQTVQFVVNKRTPALKNGRVAIKEREVGYNTWNDSLDLEFAGNPAVSRIVIERDTTAHTIYLCGNSTVTDQPTEPWASWGQMVPVWFNDSVSISNHAESGLTGRTFIAQRRLDQICETLRKGDLVICEFGHNDEKEHQPGDGAWTHYVYNLKVMIDRARKAGAYVVLCTPTQRRNFDAEGRQVQSHRDFPAAMKALAAQENVPVIDLTQMVENMYVAMGVEGSKKTLVHYPAGTFPDQDKELADNTHFNPFGAWEVSKMVVQGLIDMNHPYVQYLRPGWQKFDSLHPDDPETFIWYPAPAANTSKPDGN